jgi:hypothetical protein
MSPAPAGEEPEQGRGQPCVPLFSGRRVLVVVFNDLRGMSLIQTRGSANGFAEPRPARVVNAKGIPRRGERSRFRAWATRRGGLSLATFCGLGTPELMASFPVLPAGI